MRYVMGIVVVLAMGCGGEVSPDPDSGVASDASPDAGPECDGEAPGATYVCCGGAWVDVINDAENCGTCGAMCAGDCALGVCE